MSWKPAELEEYRNLTEREKTAAYDELRKEYLSLSDMLHQVCNQHLIHRMDGEVRGESERHMAAYPPCDMCGTELVGWIVVDGARLICCGQCLKREKDRVIMEQNREGA